MNRLINIIPIMVMFVMIIGVSIPLLEQINNEAGLNPEYISPEQECINKCEGFDFEFIKYDDKLGGLFSSGYKECWCFDGEQAQQIY